jgi:hypothetical protein
MRLNRRTQRLIIIALVALVSWISREYTSRSNSSPASDPRSPGESVETIPDADARSGADAILAAYEDRRSGLMVRSSGEVQSLLADDVVGTLHQKFIVRLPNDHTVLISHNIELAPRVPLKRGDRVDFRGQYEWNNRGGVVHWTHHDPRGRHEEGWIDHDGTRYE